MIKGDQNHENLYSSCVSFGMVKTWKMHYRSQHFHLSCTQNQGDRASGNFVPWIK